MASFEPSLVLQGMSFSQLVLVVEYHIRVITISVTHPLRSSTIETGWLLLIALDSPVPADLAASAWSSSVAHYEEGALETAGREGEAPLLGALR